MLSANRYSLTAKSHTKPVVSVTVKSRRKFTNRVSVFNIMDNFFYKTIRIYLP